MLPRRAHAARGGMACFPCLQANRRCIFCEIASGKHPDSRKIVYEDEQLVVFPDIRPAAALHLQVVPKQHITNFTSLQRCAEDYALVASMMARGQAVLRELQPGASQRLGFHRPPFNSVHHLHMHAIALPFKPYRVWKYSPQVPWWMDAWGAVQLLKPSGAEDLQDGMV